MLFNFIVSCITMTTKSESAEKRVMQKEATSVHSQGLPSGAAVFAVAGWFLRKKKEFTCPLLTRVCRKKSHWQNTKPHASAAFFFPEKEADVWGFFLFFFHTGCLDGVDASVPVVRDEKREGKKNPAKSKSYSCSYQANKTRG